jgi:hypothetical protein
MRQALIVILLALISPQGSPQQYQGRHTVPIICGTEDGECGVTDCECKCHKKDKKLNEIRTNSYITGISKLPE